jgi:hypothetical protein
MLEREFPMELRKRKEVSRRGKENSHETVELSDWRFFWLSKKT